MMNKKIMNYFIYRINLVFTIYRVKNRISLKHFYFKLYFRRKKYIEIRNALIATFCSTIPTSHKEIFYIAEILKVL